MVTLFGVEALVLVTLGSVLGLLCSVTIAVLVNRMGFTYKGGYLTEPMTFKFVLTFVTCVSSFSFLAFLGILTALATAWNEARKEIAETFTG